MPTATDTYIYLRGGRGDGFVPQWDGTLTEEGMVDGSGAVVAVGDEEPGKEVSEPYRNIFPSTTNSPNYKSYFFFASPYQYTDGGSVNNAYQDDGAAITLEGAKSRLSDEVKGVTPRQFFKVYTWLLFTSANGLVYKFRKADVIGWGARPRV